MSAKDCLNQIKKDGAFLKPGRDSAIIDSKRTCEHFSEYCITIEKDLELLEALKQRWQQEEWCEGIELSVESLNSLFKYNKDLFDKNLELDRKLAIEFEDSSDEINKISNERNNYYDKYIDLKMDIQDYETTIFNLRKRIDRQNELIDIRSKCLSDVRGENATLRLNVNRLSKALDKACERLNWDCPVSQDLISDLDCENCSNDCEKCWRKYFLLEAKKNEN